MPVGQSDERPHGRRPGSTFHTGAAPEGYTGIVALLVNRTESAVRIDVRWLVKGGVLTVPSAAGTVDTIRAGGQVSMADGQRAAGPGRAR